MRAPALIAACLCAAPLGAQDIAVPGQRADIVRGDGAVLRGLDKVAGETRDFRLQAGETARLGHLELQLGECRYPADNPAGEAYAWVGVRDTRGGDTLFDGWMIASSPALNAVDHRRYDLWVLNCITS